MQQLAYCPNHNYLLVLSNGASNESTWEQEISTPTPGETNIQVTTDYLIDNALISFSILITNDKMYTETTMKDICECHKMSIIVFAIIPQPIIIMQCHHGAVISQNSVLVYTSRVVQYSITTK